MFFELLTALACGYFLIHLVRRKSPEKPVKQAIVNFVLLGGIVVILGVATLVLLVLTGGRYEQKDFEFTKGLLAMFNPNRQGDTVRFVNAKSEQDEFVVVGERTNAKKDRGILMALPAFNSHELRIKHTGTGDTASLLEAENLPQDKKRYVTVAYKNFYFRSESGFGVAHGDTLTLKGRPITGYYKLESNYGSVTNEQDVINVYWTDKEGMVGYTTADNTLWVKK